MDLTRRLRGKTLAAVMTNGHILQLRAADGAEIDICWVDEHGRAIKGKPVCVRHGVRIVTPGLHDLINLPSARPAA